MTATAIKQGWDNGVYHDHEGERMLARDIAAEWKIEMWQIDKWGRQTCPYLAGPRIIDRKKVPNPFPGEPGLNGEVHAYLVADIKELVANMKAGIRPIPSEGEWVNRNTYRDHDGRVFMMGPAADKRFGVCKSRLHRWTTAPCPLLGRTVEHQKLQSPFWKHGRFVVVYLVDDIKKIRELECRGARVEQRDERGRLWLTNAGIQERLGVTSVFCVYWSQIKSRQRPGYALRSKLVPNTAVQKGSHSRITVYLLDDAEAIARREESESKFEGRGAISDEQQKRLAKEAQRVLKMILANGPVEVSEAERMAAECGMTRSALHGARKALGKRIITRREKYGPGTWSLRGVKAKAPASEPTHLVLPNIKTATINDPANVEINKHGGEKVKWFTVTQAARIVSTNTGTITREVNEGRLQSNGKNGRERRISSNALIAWLVTRNGISDDEKEWQAQYETLRRKIGVTD